jgi:hypothetical protein
MMPTSHLCSVRIDRRGGDPLLRRRHPRKAALRQNVSYSVALAHGNLDQAPALQNHFFPGWREDEARAGNAGEIASKIICISGPPTTYISASS